MHLNKTILATALLVAFSGVTCASEYQWIDYDGDPDNNYHYNDGGVGTHNPILSTSVNDEGEHEFSGKAQLDTTDSKQNALLSSNADRKVVVNSGDLWVIGSGNGVAMDSTGNKIINKGTIYVGGDDPNQVKGMNANVNSTAINDGVIIVNGGAGLEDGSGVGSKTLTNTGIIAVVGDGIGINFRKEGGEDIKVSNDGTILVTGSGTGVHIGDPDFSSSGPKVDKTFTNNGIINATNGVAIKVHNREQNTTLNFMKDSQVDGLIDVNDSTTLTYKNNSDTLTLADEAGVINTTEGSKVTVELGTESGLSIGEVKTDATSEIDFHLDRTGTSDSPVLEIGSVVEGSNVKYGYTGSVNDDVLAGSVSQENLFKGIQIGEDAESPDKVYAEEGEWAAATVYNADGTKQVLGENSLLSSATDLAITNALMWRSQLSNLTDRMGTLRTMPETAGAWARYNGGRFDGRGIQHDYNTVEVGFDKAISNNVMLGVSFDYTKGDTDLDAGTSDNNTYTLGLYGSYFNESGCFLDAMLKVGRIDTDYDLNNGISEKGDYMLTGTIVGIETGHRWNIQNYFIEPQVQLTYSYLRPENYNTNLREVKFDDMKSLIARVGIMGGMKFAEDRGSAYVKASYNHDFLGDIEGNYSGVTAAGNAVRVNVDDELDDNWGEVSLGASYQVTDSVNTFVDVGTGFGGDIDQKWRVNLGARYVF